MRGARQTPVKADEHLFIYYYFISMNYLIDEKRVGFLLGYLEQADSMLSALLEYT